MNIVMHRDLEAYISKTALHRKWKP